MSIYRPLNSDFYFDPTDMTKLPKADLHVHTNISACGDQKNATADNMLTAAKESGFSTVCFSNHLWDSEIEGASSWYAPQNFEHIMTIKEQLPHQSDMNVYVGAEVEFATFKKNALAITEQHARELDIVLVPHSHTHMVDFVVSKDDCKDIETHARFLLKSFYAVLNNPLAKYIDVIVHPFAALYKQEWMDEAVNYISDEDLLTAFSQAAKQKIALEVNAGTFDSKTTEQAYNSGFIRMIRLAIKAGCNLTFGSDSHTPSAYKKTLPQVMAMLSQI